MRKIKVTKNKLELVDDIEYMFEKKVTKFGTGAKIDANKRHIGKKVYILVRKSNSRKYLNKINEANIK